MSLCHIEMFHNKMQLDIVVKPFINVFACIFDILVLYKADCYYYYYYYYNDLVRYFMST